MKILSCYVENFGKIHHFSYSFQDGLNMIKQENGWGKTTFAAFIKAMFFGLDYKQGKTMTDRKRYLPWNEQKFGGYLIFEHNGIAFKIERFFGKRDKEDTYHIYNLATNLLSEEFGENLGEEIWKVNKDSFEKTAFISLEESELLNDIISGKLGNIEEQEADMETSSRAIAILEEAMAAIKFKRGRGGKLEESKNTIRALKEELKISEQSIKNIENLLGHIKKQKIELTDVKNSIRLIEEQIAKFVLYEKKRTYNDIMEEYVAKKQEYLTINDFFNGNVISDKDMEVMSKHSIDYENRNRFILENQMSYQEISELEELKKLFLEGVPSPQELEQCNDHIAFLSNQYRNLYTFQLSDQEKEVLQQLEQKYAGSTIDAKELDQYLKDYHEVMNLVRASDELEREVLEQKNWKRAVGKQTVFTPLLLLGIIVAIVGIFSFFFTKTIGVLLIGSGFLETIVALFLQKRKISKKKTAIDEQIQLLQNRIQKLLYKIETLRRPYIKLLEDLEMDTENIVLELSNIKMELSEFERLKAECARSNEEQLKRNRQISDTTRNIESFLGRYELDSKADFASALINLRKKLTLYKELSAKEKIVQDAQKKAEQAKNYLEPIFLMYFDAFPNDIVDTMSEIRRNKILYARLKSEFEAIKTKKEYYESQNNIAELEILSLPDRDENQLKESLLDEKKQLERKKEELLKRIHAYEKDINNHSILADKAEDLESAIAKEEEEYESLEREYSLISKTKQCMEEAKEELAVKYIKPMSEAFKKYFAEIEKKPIENYQLDIRLNVRVEEEGQLHDSVELSKGMKDLIQVCMRMALIEAVYQEVAKPILILDDPFVNLDDVRLNNAVKLFKRISENYQMIYFICHDSRSV